MLQTEESAGWDGGVPEGGMGATSGPVGEGPSRGRVCPGLLGRREGPFSRVSLEREGDVEKETFPGGQGASEFWARSQILF